MDLRTLSAEEVLTIHEVLVRDFAEASDPISPPGVRSVALLQSAVGRQLTGIGDTLKYPEAIGNAATLLYGLCNDHPFHNGNKRTALVAMLVHLDRNKLTLYHTSQTDLYDLMLKVASHTITGVPDKRARRPRSHYDADGEVEKISEWLKERVDSIKKGDRTILYRDARKIIEGFGYTFGKQKGNSIEVLREVEVKKGLVFKKRVLERKHIGSINWPGENSEMPIGTIKKLRMMCRLREEDGVDSDAFYNGTAIIDSFVNRYRSVLRRLARV